MKTESAKNLTLSELHAKLSGTNPETLFPMKEFLGLLERVKTPAPEIIVQKAKDHIRPKCFVCGGKILHQKGEYYVEGETAVSRQYECVHCKERFTTREKRV